MKLTNVQTICILIIIVLLLLIHKQHAVIEGIGKRSDDSRSTFKR